MLHRHFERVVVAFVQPGQPERCGEQAWAHRVEVEPVGVGAAHDGGEPAFVPLAIAADPPEPVNRLPLTKLASDGPKVQVLTLEIGPDVVMRVPHDVPVERVAALVRAVRGAS